VKQNNEKQKGTTLQTEKSVFFSYAIIKAKFHGAENAPSQTPMYS